MIDIKSNLDRLEDTASILYNQVQNNGTHLSVENSVQTASDIRGAIQDISNLRDSNAILERNIREMSAEINTLKTAPVDLGEAINTAIKCYVQSAVVDNGQLDALEARLETVELVTADLDADSIDGLEQMIDDRIEEASCGNDRDDETRDTVRDMIRDGEIIVTVDLS